VKASNSTATNGVSKRCCPCERETASATYFDVLGPRAFVIVPQAVVAKWLESFKEFPIRQKPASFNLCEVVQGLTTPQGRG
jgi:hypothetical protein